LDWQLRLIGNANLSVDNCEKLPLLATLFERGGVVVNSPQNVAEMAQLLDHKKPDWFQKVSLSRLDMSNGSHCILGQIFGDYVRGLHFLGIDDRSNKTLNILNNNELRQDWTYEIRTRLDKENLMEQQIYRVEGSNVDRNFFIAYATGNEADIRMYFDDRKGYGLELDAVRPIHITPEMTQEKYKLLVERERIERRLKEIEGLLKTRK
jgi:hypothetical protein